MLSGFVYSLRHIFSSHKQRIRLALENLRINVCEMNKLGIFVYWLVGCSCSCFTTQMIQQAEVSASDRET